MRYSFVLGLMLATAGCGSPRPAEAPEAKPAELTFDGAGAAENAALVKHGKRVAAVLACTGCHGDDLQGSNVTKDDPEFGDMNAPNLTLLLAGYSDAELGRVIRQGVPKDGREFWFMPSEAYQFLSEADLAALIAHLRTVKPGGKPMPPIRKGPKFEQEVASGKFANAADTIRRFAAKPPVDLGEGHAFGRRVAQVACSGCHNSELQGYEGFSPNLDIAGAYDAAELETLLTTGKGKSKPDLGLMTIMGRDHFVQFTPRERAAVIAYVKARADRPQ
ncbi:MAG: c-type cytochrome [Sphingomicrobium sp.]